MQANATRPAEFLYDNLMIHATVLHAAYRTGVEKLLYLGSSCIYPRDCCKVMLLSGARRAEAHKLYAALGFDGDVERGFVIKP